MSQLSAMTLSRPLDTEDERLAAQTKVPLLISAPCVNTVTAVARRIHSAGFGATAPFVRFPASELVDQREQFASQWTMLMEAGRGGSILITDVDQLSRAAQALLIESLNELSATRSTLTGRLMTGTTVSLLDRVEAGEFLEELLYCLNVIHLLMLEESDACPEPAGWPIMRR